MFDIVAVTVVGMLFVRGVAARSRRFVHVSIVRWSRVMHRGLSM